MSEKEGETWGEMLSAWESDKDNHHDLCYLRKLWDMRCDCQFIKKVEFNKTFQLADLIKHTHTENKTIRVAINPMTMDESENSCSRNECTCHEVFSLLMGTIDLSAPKEGK